MPAVKAAAKKNEEIKAAACLAGKVGLQTDVGFRTG